MREKHKPTDAMRQTVQLHTTVGTPQSIIADILGIDDKTLRLHYRAELDLAKAKANATIGGALYNKAKGGDTAAMIFWMKTQAGWRETSQIEHAGDVNLKLTNASDILGPRLDAIASRTVGAPKPD